MRHEKGNHTVAYSSLRLVRLWRSLFSPVACIFIALVAVGCSSSPRFYLQYGSRLTRSELDRILAENPLPVTENIKVTTLGQAAQVSHHIVQIRDRETPHIHKEHDVTVILSKGKGYLMLGKERVDLAEGDVLFIPRGVVHYFINTSTEPSVAFAIFSPPFDGKDAIPLDKP